MNSALAACNVFENGRSLELSIVCIAKSALQDLELREVKAWCLEASVASQ